MNFRKILFTFCFLFAFVAIKARAAPTVVSDEVETGLLVFFHEYAVENANYLGSLDLSILKVVEDKANSGRITQTQIDDFYLNGLRFSKEMYQFVIDNSGELMNKYKSSEHLIESLEVRYKALLNNGTLVVPAIYGSPEAPSGCAWRFLKTVFISAGTAAAGCSTGIGCVGAGIVVGTMFGDLCRDCCSG
jgi:hypothetical protein